MPTYEYRCKGECDDVMDITQSMKDDAFTKCPNCGTTDFYRVVSGGAGFIKKGNDWPGKVVAMASEDDKLIGLSRKVKALKAEGRIPMEAVVPTQEATRDTTYNKAYPEKPELHPKNVYGSS